MSPAHSALVRCLALFYQKSAIRSVRWSRWYLRFRPLFLFFVKPVRLFFLGFGGDSECGKELPKPLVSYFRSYVIRRGVTPAVSDPVTIFPDLVNRGNAAGRNAVLLLEGLQHSTVKIPLL